MFKHLIESNSQREDIARRGSFFLATTAAYAVILMAAGVASIYAYDAHLESQSTELAEIVFVPPDSAPRVATPKPKSGAPKSSAKSASNSSAAKESVRPVLYESAANPRNVPDKLGAVGTGVTPALPGSKIGSFNSDPGGIGPAVGPPSTRGNGRVGSTVNPPIKIPVDDAPPELPTPTPRTRQLVKSLGVANGLALEKPAPPYPPIARDAGVSGTVTVQILLDEKGKVISARATAGHPLLRAAAVGAAYRARFSPTTLSNVPVKASGVLTYNFILR